MLRRIGQLAVLAAGMGISAVGCRSCDSCNDYAPPVANCDCGCGGCHRTGSASSAYAQGGYASSQVVEGPYVQQDEWSEQ
jgi:hypothetical protein